MNVADVLERAADIMGARGHSQSMYIDHDGSCCLMGALWLAVNDNDYTRGWVSGFCHPALDVLYRANPYLHAANRSWNKDEAVAVLRACAAVERARAAVAETVAA